MSFTRAAFCGFLVIAVCASCSWAAVPIDRPSPPPYCADGKCYPKRDTWGYYQGRWRSWPGVDTRPGPTEKGPTPAELLGPDLKSYETPTPQNEDKRAPPPTQPREESLGLPAVPPPAGAGGEPTAAPAPGGAPAGPGAGPTAPAAPGATPTTEPHVPMPIPSGRPRLGTGEEDYPPTPPFGSSPLQPSLPPGPSLPYGSPPPSVLPENVPGDLPIRPSGAQLRRSRVPDSMSDDPPPPLPIALGGLASR
jgi:hypothetical protein